MPTDYVVIHSELNSAKIIQNQEERASLQRTGKGVFNLQDKKNIDQSWTLSIKVDGEMRPFSMACYEASGKSAGVGGQSKEACFKMKDHLFSHNNNFYSVGEAVPEGVSRHDAISGSKYICRLINFPFSHIDHVDEETKHQMKRYRGVAVGEINGIGLDGYRLKLYEDELADIGLQLTASTYVAYTTHSINVTR